VKYTTFPYSHVYFFWFLNSPTNESVGPIFTLYTSNDVVLRKKLLFKAKNKKNLTQLFEKFEKKITMALMGKIF